MSHVQIGASQCPSKCGSWRPNSDDECDFNFTLQKQLWDESHDQFRLYLCESCNTHYLWHWHEEIGWDDSDDSVSIYARPISNADVIAANYFAANEPLGKAFRSFLFEKISE